METEEKKMGRNAVKFKSGNQQKKKDKTESWLFAKINKIDKPTS